MDAVMTMVMVDEFDYIESIDRLVTIAEPPQGLLAGASVRSDAREQVPRHLENATDVNSGEIPNLNPDEVCERPWA